MEQITHIVRYSMWKDILFQCRNRPDGMSAKQWLKENQISEKSYYYWQGKFRNELFEEQGTSLLALQSSSNCTDISFAEAIMPKERVAVDDLHNEIIRASAVIKTETLTIAISNDISDMLTLMFPNKRIPTDGLYLWEYPLATVYLSNFILYQFVRDIIFGISLVATE